jgi:hypothetical protein
MLPIALRVIAAAMHLQRCVAFAAAAAHRTIGLGTSLCRSARSSA